MSDVVLFVWKSTVKHLTTEIGDRKQMKFPQTITSAVTATILVIPLALLDSGCSLGGACTSAAQAYESCQMTQSDEIQKCTKKYWAMAKKARLGGSESGQAALERIWDGYNDCTDDAPTCISQKTQFENACGLNGGFHL